MKIDCETVSGEKRAPEGSTPEYARVAIVVCGSCRDDNGSDDRPRPGERLADDARRAAAGTPFRVETVECLGNCKRRLSASILREGGWSFVFGDLTPSCGIDLIEGARLLAASQDSLMPWRGRPDSLKRGLVARIPPIFSHKDSVS